MKDVIEYDTLMGFGRTRRSFEFDFSKVASNEGDFTLKVIQDDTPDDIGTEIKFTKEFES